VRFCLNFVFSDDDRDRMRSTSFGVVEDSEAELNVT